ncbi:MAG: membrane integrity-associated transporter subunit PqiC [Gammaproteobacteria bacterium]|nr:membrane integrity-associated transporter subunit PqiC [Gammaproteobacteria bacterium]
MSKFDAFLIMLSTQGLLGTCPGIKNQLQKRIFFLPLILLLGHGCVSNPGSGIHYYLLTPSSPGESISTHRHLNIGIGPIELPEYLSRPHIFTQTGKTQLKSNKQHRWAGSLENNFTDVLATDLGLQLQKSHIEIYPWDRPRTVDRQIVVHVTRFIAEGKTVYLDARWRVLDKQGDQRKIGSARLQNSLENNVADDDFDAIVSLMSDLVGELAHEIAILL